MCKTFPVILVLVTSYFIIIVQTVNVLNAARHGHDCNYWNPSGTSIYLLSLEQCKKECCERASCRAVDYFRKEQKCALLQAEDTYGSMDKESECVHIKKGNYKCPQTITWPEHENCDDINETCDVKECSSIGEIPNAVVLGNVNHIGSRLKIKCAAGYRGTSNRTISACRPNGSWSYQLQCIKITIGYNCTSDSDCMESGSVCIQRTCFCGPLYRYNKATMDCVKVCSRMTTDFTAYSGIFIRCFNLEISCVIEPRTCCLKNETCLSFEESDSQGVYYGVITYEMAMDAYPALHDVVVKNQAEKLYSRKCN